MDIYIHVYVKKNTLLRVIPTMTFINLILTNLLAFHPHRYQPLPSNTLFVCDVASRSAASLPNATWRFRLCQSMWHIFWHSIWHIFWHSIWHIF